MELQSNSSTGIDAEDMRLLGGTITRRIVGCAMRVHAALGPGLLESAYRAALLRELEIAGLATLSEVPIGLTYKGVPIDCGFRADVIVERKVVLELKSVERILPIHTAQLMTYLKLTRLHVGLIINFGTVHLRHGLKRVVL